MKSDERIVSKSFNKLLKCIGNDVYEANTIKYTFIDSKGQEFVHYQVKPEFCGKRAQSRAIAYITKMGKNPIGKYYSCRCVCRMMNDDRMWADVDEIYKHVSKKEGDDKFAKVQQASNDQ